MKEIKFRGLSKFNQQWVYGDLVHIQDSEGSCIAIKDTTYHVNDGWINLIPTAIVENTEGQYTGKKDRHEKETYDGDIIKTESFTWIVYFGENQDLTGNWGWCAKNIQTEKTYFLEDSILSGEIIGNVHEDKDLLCQD